MLLPLIFGVITAVLGGVSMIVFEAWHNNTYKRFSDISPILWLGDTVILPAYNALTITAVLATTPSVISLFAAGTTALIAAYLYQNWDTRFSLQERFTPTEIYHIVFIIFESFYITLTAFTPAFTPVAALILLSYAATAAYTVLIT
jgi:uncharacterized membrane protein